MRRGSGIPVTFADGDEFGARAWENGLVQVFRNGTLQGQADVTGWPAYSDDGYIGLFMLNAGAATLDDFGGGAFVMPQP